MVCGGSNFTTHQNSKAVDLTGRTHPTPPPPPPLPQVWNPATQITTIIGVVPVFDGNEDGLLGLVLDPNFETNRRLYFYYSPIDPLQQPIFHNQLSRFTLLANGSLDLTSEKVLLVVPTQRRECCHMGGDMHFRGMDLYVSTSPTLCRPPPRNPSGLVSESPPVRWSLWRLTV